MEKGISFYPLQGETKKPTVIDIRNFRLARLRWKPYQTKLPTEQEILYWFETLRSKGIAIITGSISKLAVIDCDNEQAIDDYIQICEDSNAPSPFETTYVYTKRGMHFYYRIYTPLISYSNVFQNPNIELKAERMSVTAPPSRFVGVRGNYMFQGEKILDIPEFIIERVNNIKEIKLKRFNLGSESISQGNIDGIVERAAMEIHRNKACYKMCKALKNQGITLPEAKQHVIDFVRICGQKEHPFTRDEAMSCLYSAYKL